MSLEEKKEQLNSPKPSEPAEEEKAPEPKLQEEDSSAWHGERHLRSSQIKNWAKSNEAFRETKMREAERKEIADRVFGSSGSYLTKSKGEKILKKLNHERSYAKSDADRERIKKEIRVAKSILGKD